MRFLGMRALARLNNAAGTRVQHLEIDGSPIDPAREYTVAAAGDHIPTGHHERSMTGLRAIDSMRTYLREERPAHTPATDRSLIAM